MIETVLGFLVRIVGFALNQWLGYWAGRAAIQALSLGRLDVADFGYHNQKSGGPFWYHGKQRVVSFWVAIAVGHLLWFAVFGAILYLLLG